MELTLQSFLRFLRNFITLFRKGRDHLARRLWYIFTAFRLRFSSQHPKKTDNIRRKIQYRPATPSPTTVICASRLPPRIRTSTPDSNISIEVRQPTILVGTTEGNPDESHDNDNDHLDINGHFRTGLSDSPDFTGYHEEPDTIQVVPPDESASTSPVTPSRPNSTLSSPYSYRPPSQYDTRHWRGSQYSQRPPSERSYRSFSNLNGAESAALGYLPDNPSPRPSSPVKSICAPSVAPSVASRVYRGSKPTPRVRRPSPMTNVPRRRDRSPALASVRLSVHETHPGVSVPEAPQPESQTTGSVHRDRNSAAVNFGPSPPPNGTLRPVIGIDRYETQQLVIVEDVIKNHVCPPVTTEFLRESLPENWTPLMHPEGVLYWVHVDHPIYTDTDMCDPVLRQRIEAALEEIDELKESSPPLPDDWELALELGKDTETEEPICSYYFVRLSTRCLFWLHEFDPESAMANLRGVTERTHIHLALQAQYWYHWEMFPHNREVPEELIQELLGILVHAGVDCMTSPNSTAAYSEGDLSKLLAYVKYVSSVGGNYGFSACVVGRLMCFVTYSRYINFYGQKGARLTNDQTIYGYQPKRTYLIKTLSLFFFFAPELHLSGLESVYTDFVLCQHRWAQFITRLQDDWKEFILYGTVLLNANVAFLAIPSVDPGNRNRTPSQLASYLSIITSVGSIVIGLLLLRHHRTKPQDSADEVDKYLQSRRDNALGFETLAILYSLPYSLLLWSTMAFTTAFGLETLVYSRQVWTKLSVGIAFAMMILLISWCIWTTIEAGTDFSVLGSVHDLKERLVAFTRDLRGGTSNHGPDAGDGDDRDSQGRNGKFPLPGPLKDAINFARRRRGISTSSTLVQTVGNESRRPSNSTGVEMSKINNKEPESV